MTINLQPLLAAAAQIRFLMDQRQTLIAGEPMMAAVRSFQEALGPNFIPGLPLPLLQSLQTDMDRLAARVNDAPLSRLEALGFVYTLQQRKVWPDRNEDEAGFLAAIERIIATGPETAAETMKRGGTYMARSETIRGLDFLGGAAALLRREPERSPQARRELDRPTSRTPESAKGRTVPEGHTRPFSTLLADANRYLMVEGVSYDTNGRETEGPIQSAYRFERWNDRRGEPMPIAIGGCSRVYLGREEGTNRLVAIKIVTIKDEEMSEALLQSFEKERKFQTALSSDEFVHVYSTGVTASGNPYIVMEYCDGGSLDDFIIDAFEMAGGLAEEQIIDIAIKMARPVAIAHRATFMDDEGIERRGIVHRDIKPANYMRTSGGQVKLADFGLAELEAQLPSDPPENLFGTVGYIPYPAEPDTKRRDIYALASSYYELITGQPAFEGHSTYAIMYDTYQKDYEILRRNMAARGVSEALIRIVLKGLARDRSRRHADGDELLFELSTVKARALEEEAEDIFRRSMIPGASPQTRRDEWKEKIEEALREYGRVHKEGPNAYITAKMVELNLKLHRYGSDIGDERLVRQTSDIILHLSPDSEAAREVNRPIHVDFTTEGMRPHPGARTKVTLEGFSNRAGFLVRERISPPRDRVPPQGLDLKGNSAARIVHVMEGAMPVAVPLPVRPGRYGVRIPIYRSDAVPEFARSWTVIPAGPAIVKTQIGSHSERPTLARETESDILMGPPVDRRLWEIHFKRIWEDFGEEEARRRIPAIWLWDRGRNQFVDLKGSVVPPDAPVTHVTSHHVREFLELMMPGARVPFLDEWKRALRGNDARPWPWGNAAPDSSESLIAGCRHFLHPVQVAPLPNSMTGLLDMSPFSVYLDGSNPAHAIPHIALNIRKFLSWPDTREARARMLRAVRLEEDPDDPAIPERHVFLAGGSYDQAAPTNVEMIQYKPIDFVGPVGILPVLPLAEAVSSPTLDSLLK